MFLLTKKRVEDDALFSISSIADIEFLFWFLSDEDDSAVSFVGKAVFSLSKSISKLLLSTIFLSLFRFLLTVEVEKEVELGGGGGGVVERSKENNFLKCFSLDSFRMFSDVWDLLEVSACWDAICF